MSHLKPPRTTHPTAVLTVPLSVGDGTSDLPDGLNVQLLPDGSFTARDGRPASMTKGALTAWCLDADIAAPVVADAQARETPLVIDYEHQTLNARQNGKPAPAAGWIDAVTYLPGRGLFAAVTWTERARAYIEAGEYRFISPVFSFDAATGAVLRLISAALTNTPALDGMSVVAAVEDLATQETAMDELLERLRWMLNLPVTATAQDIMAQLDKLKAMLGGEGEAAATDGAPPAGQPAPVDLLALLTEQRAQIAALSAATPDPARFVPMEALTALQQSAAALQARVAELETGQTVAAMAVEIDAALADGRLNRAVEPWARELARTDPDALRNYLSVAVPVAALTAMQTTRVTPQPVPGTAALTDEDTYTMNQLGLTPEEFRASKEGK
ncbi:phage protease [Nitratidesulfovibrio sp.]|uniref:phage protease n=1 Tax=Nitratidesulfovibrio sp. TaxID=2802297 RepID=UPI003340EFA8